MVPPVQSQSRLHAFSLAAQPLDQSPTAPARTPLDAAVLGTLSDRSPDDIGASGSGEAPSPLERAILQSVVYAAVFDYPLTLPQLHETVVGVPASEEDVERACRTSPFLRARIGARQGYLFPLGRADFILKRHEREGTSLVTLRRHQGLLRLLCAVPYARLVALSGSLAHLNGPRAADVDLFVITAPGRVWSVTLVMLLLAKLCGRRRSVCLNYVISERRLKLEQEDLFTANQIVHLRPLHGAEVYRRFLEANSFVKCWYPNHPGGGRDVAVGSLGVVASVAKRAMELVASCGPAQVAEYVARTLYRRYLRRQAHRWQSPEQVRLEPECLKLHTRSHRGTVMAAYSRELDRR